MPSLSGKSDPSTWDPKFDAVAAAPNHHKVIFENEKLRVLEVTLEPQDEEPLHHHRWPSVFALDSIHDGTLVKIPLSSGYYNFNVRKI